MRLLFSITYFSPYISGLTLYVKRLAEALSERGFKSTILCMQYERNLPLTQTINDVKVIRAKPLFRISKGFLSLDWLVKSWIGVNETDLVLINLPQFEGFIPAVFGRLFKKKVISIYHCEVELPKGLLNNFIQSLLILSNLLTLHLTDVIITYTKDFAQHSQLLPRFANKINYVYPPIIGPKVDKRVQDMIREKIGEKPDSTIGVAARLAAEKGIEYLLESIPAIEKNLSLSSRAKSRDLSRMRARTSREIPRRVTPRNDNKISFKIIVAGPLEPVGEENYKKKIIKLVQMYKDQIVFLGSLKEEDMGSFYSLLDILVLPSINSTEAFGMVQVEAMMMGVPVVATDLPGVRVPILKTGMGLLVPIKNSNKLAGAIAEVLVNKKKYLKDKDKILEEFSFEKTIEYYINLF